MPPTLRSFLRVPSLRSWLGTVALCYVGLALYSCMADSIIFHPPPSSYHDVPGQLKLAAADGNQITAVSLPNPAAAYVLLFSHGNAEDLGYNEDIFHELQKRGWAVFAYDYPGYGTSTGRPGEAGCYAAMDAAYAYLVTTKHVPAERIVLYGRSLGSGPAIDLASRKPVGGLIVEGAFTSTYRVMTHYRLLPWDEFNNIAKIPLVHAPLLSIHAANDHTVPFWHGEAVYNAHPGPKQHLWVAGADHNSILGVAPAAYWEAMEKFRRSLPNKDPISSGGHP